MIKKSLAILKNKQSLYILILFILFFPLKTQLQNLLMFLFDFFFRNGITSEVFNYNYRGSFIGCEQVLKMTTLYPNFSWFQKHGIYYLNFLPSLIAGFILLRRWKKDVAFQIFDWFLVIVTCFSVYTSLNDLYFLVINYKEYNTGRILRFLPSIVLFLSIGVFIFLKVFTFKQRLQVIVFGCMVWFSWPINFTHHLLKYVIFTS